MKVVIILILLMSSSVLAGLPKPAKSEYFEGQGGGFNVIKDEGVTYTWYLKIIKDLPAGYSLKASFENPNKHSTAIIETQKLEVRDGEIFIESARLDCVRSGKKYRVVLNLYSDASGTVKLSSHKGKIQFKLPKVWQERMGVVAC